MHAAVDALIVGGGPSGCATALAMRRRGLTACIVDRRGGTAEPVGETLPPRAFDVLSALGVWNRFRGDHHAPSLGVQSAWGTARPRINDFLFHPHGCGWHLDRARFNRMMVDAAQQAGALVYAAERPIAYERARAGWNARFDHATGSVHIAATVLVDATGRGASIARRLGARRIVSDLLVASARFYRRASGAGETPQFTLVESTRDGWWYSACLPRDRMVVVAFGDPEARRRMRPPRYTRARVAPHGPPVHSGWCAAQSACLDRAAGPGWIAVGDAASAWDPLSSQGIVQGLRSGIAAAEAIARYLSADAFAFDAYARDKHAAFQRYIDLQRTYYRREMRWPDAPFWKRRHGFRNTFGTDRDAL